MKPVVLWIIIGGIFFGGVHDYGSLIGSIKHDGKSTHTHSDGVDFVPSKPQVLLGHHFASIAGSGPIVGPIQAVIFGWILVKL